MAEEPDWTALEHAYGSAADIPALLAELSPDPADDVWNALWSRVCHQGSVYSASFPVLPRLLDAIVEWPPAARIMPLVLAAGIASSTDRHRCGDTSAFAPVIDDLHRVALVTLATKGLERDDF